MLQFRLEHGPGRLGGGRRGHDALQLQIELGNAACASARRASVVLSRRVAVGLPGQVPQQSQRQSNCYSNYQSESHMSSVTVGCDNDLAHPHRAEESASRRNR